MAPKNTLTRINLTGCSGIGKTTLAKALSEIYDIPFISGSYSDLVPETKNMSHRDMIQQDAEVIFEQDVQVLNLRNKLFFNNPRLVSDRSYVDSAAYMINKLSHRLPNCEIEDFIEKCRVLTLLYCPKIIYLPFTLDYFTQWKFEDNGKRVVNNFYQAEVTSVIDWLFGYWGCEFEKFIYSDMEESKYGNEVICLKGEIDGKKLCSEILVLKELSHEVRLDIIDKFLSL